MSSGERPIGAAKGTQSDPEALCQTPPPPPSPDTGVSKHLSPVLPHFRFFAEPSVLRVRPNRGTVAL